MCVCVCSCSAQIRHKILDFLSQLNFATVHIHFANNTHTNMHKLIHVYMYIRIYCNLFNSRRPRHNALFIRRLMQFSGLYALYVCSIVSSCEWLSVGTLEVKESLTHSVYSVHSLVWSSARKKVTLYLLIRELAYIHNITATLCRCLIINWSFTPCTQKLHTHTLIVDTWLSYF